VPEVQSALLNEQADAQAAVESLKKGKKIQAAAAYAPAAHAQPKSPSLSISA
jgi:hypothetical protein